MNSKSFKALVLTQQDGKTVADIQAVSIDDLPEGDVLVAVSHSSLNYKDGLAVTGKGKVVRRFPMVPGVDLAGVVEESSDPRYQAGDSVLLTGWGVGEGHWGGYAQKARLRGDWLTPLPDGLTAAQAMAFGTAGFTAMLCVMVLEARGLSADQGPVLVTGASGGVGSIALSLLAQAGYSATASTGRSESHEYLKQLGAQAIIDRQELSRACKPMEKEAWAGAIDTVGGETLATVLSQMRYGGTVAACGLAGGIDLPATVFPFILRGVGLQGVDSVMCPPERRNQAWQRLVRALPGAQLEAISHTISLEQVPDYAQKILRGEVRGRVVIDTAV